MFHNIIVSIYRKKKYIVLKGLVNSESVSIFKTVTITILNRFDFFLFVIYNLPYTNKN